MHRIVIIGGGFAGLYAAKSLARVPYDLSVTLIDRRNFHLFQPLLYQVATGGLSPANIAAPLRSILKRFQQVQVLLGEVAEIDLASKEVLISDGGHGASAASFDDGIPSQQRIAYDTLIVASGVTHQYFGHAEWEQYAPGLKSLEDAVDIRRRILYAFEAAEREGGTAATEAWLTFAVVGGGATGVELAGAIAEIARYTLRFDFRAINPAAAKVLLLEAGDRVLPSYPPDLSQQARRALEKLGVQVLLNSAVQDVNAEALIFDRDGQRSSLPARTVLWAAGVKASPLAHCLEHDAEARLDRQGRVYVEPNLTLAKHPEVFVIGDLARFEHQTGAPLPGTAPVAMQQGRYVARIVQARLSRGRESHELQREPFRYRHYGSMATIGRAAAVADLGALHISGLLGWLAWLFIHLMYLVQFDNRLLVLIQWAWSYFTRNRSARLITGNDLSGESLPPDQR